jgi:murein L,D-transpeptidase YcbB/YkuD
LKEDVIPALTKNRSYLTNKNISLINREGDTISPSQWEHANARNYRYVQSPGYDNSLGLVKMSFPNRFSVFIHDTNHRELFDRNKRSLSSGCVRVEDPIALSEEILSASENWDMDKINETLENRKTKYVSVKNKINFQLLYWTAWSKNGQLVFRDDIYDLDQDLYNKLYK